MIEKYGADPTLIPYTDEQYREIKKIASEIGADIPEFITQKQAQDAIDNLQKVKQQMGVE